MTNPEKLMKTRTLITVLLVLFFSLEALFWVKDRSLKYFEGGSYYMPVISIQYRGSMVITPEDLERARADFPMLCGNLYTYDDLPSARLIKIDDDHWLPFYFPIYAILCLPMKLLLGAIGRDQSFCFSYTNVLIYILALIRLAFWGRKKQDGGLAALLFFVISPLWLHFTYVGIEPVACAAVMIAMTLWDEEHHRAAALLIGICSMANPTIIGLAVPIFFDYLASESRKDKRYLATGQGLADTGKLCLCYVPVLVPFAVNLYYLHKPVSGTEGLNTPSIDSYADRVLAYLFDLNFGLVNISLVVSVLFFAALIYAVIRREIRLFFYCLSGALAILLFSVWSHINCGMFGCARYLLWTYPAILFAAAVFMEKCFTGRMRIEVCGLAVALGLITFRVNGFYSSNEFCGVSKILLDRYPALYVSFCDSTFVARATQGNGGYELDSFVVYSDSETGELRKMLYRNTPENRDAILQHLSSPQDPALAWMKEMLDANEKDGELVYLNIPRSTMIQYQVHQ